MYHRADVQMRKNHDNTSECRHKQLCSERELSGQLDERINLVYSYVGSMPRRL
jgi:hypothetical protein